MDLDELDLDELASVLYTAVVSDACDQIGLRAQVSEQATLPLTATTKTIVGWARTMHYVEPPSDWRELPPYAKAIEITDSLRPGDVVVADSVVGRKAALWGELFSTAALGRGARGAILSGCLRDRRQIEELGFPVHALGTLPSDSLGRAYLQQVDEPLQGFGVEVTTGDFVIADLDGIVVVPRAAAPDVLDRALTKARTESVAKRMLLEGGKLADVWERLHVL